MREFRLRWRLGGLGLSLIQEGNKWVVTNNGTKKYEIRHDFESLEAVRAWLNAGGMQ